VKYATVSEIVRELEEDPVERSGHVYHRIPFPEFAHLTASSSAESAQQKLELVRNVLDGRRARGLPCDRLLDIGANAGLFTFSLAETVGSVTAYEPHPRYGPIGEYLASARTPNVDWRPRPFALDEVTESWDVALMLSSFQWITEGDRKLEDGRRLLQALSRNVKCLIFELGLNSGSSAVTTRRRNHVGAIYHLLRRSTEYPHVDLVARTKPWEGAARSGWRYTFVCSQDDDAVPEVWYAPLKYVNV